MKLYAVFVWALSLIALPAAAQHHRWGVKAGINYGRTSLRKLTADYSDYLSGLHLGVVGRREMGGTGHWQLQAEVLYSGKGDRYRVRSASYRRRQHYLDVPLLVRFTTRGFALEAGPQVGYLLAALGEGPNGTNRSRAGLRTFLPSYVTGVGYEWSSGYNVTVRYSAGLVPVTQGGGLLDGPNHVGLQAQLGYVFGNRP